MIVHTVVYTVCSVLGYLMFAFTTCQSVGLSWAEGRRKSIIQLLYQPRRRGRTTADVRMGHATQVNQFSAFSFPSYGIHDK